MGNDYRLLFTGKAPKTTPFNRVLAASQTNVRGGNTRRGGLLTEGGKFRKPRKTKAPVRAEGAFKEVMKWRE